MNKVEVKVKEEKEAFTKTLDQNLQTQLESLNEEEQNIIKTLVERFNSTRKSNEKFDSLSLIHQYLKADPDYTDFSVYENMNLVKGPRVFKNYDESREFQLPSNFLKVDQPLDKLLEERSAQHDFGPEAISQELLSTFLHYSYGVKRYISAYNIKNFPVRYAPSAGGLQPVDLFLVVNQVEDLPKGLYYYRADRNSLLLLDEGNMRSEMVRCCIYSDFVAYAPVVCIMTCNLDRVLWKYGERSYRFVHTDTGVLTENMFLVGTALNLNVCPLAAYYDDKVNDWLQIDGRKEFASLLLTIGHKPFGGYKPNNGF